MIPDTLSLTIQSTEKPYNIKKVTHKGPITLYKRPKDNASEPLPFLHFSYSNSEYKVLNPKDFSDDLWLKIPPVIPHAPTFFELKTKDIIKIGETMIEILTIHSEQKNQSHSHYSSLTNSRKPPLFESDSDFLTEHIDFPAKDPDSTHPNLCRICYTEISEKEGLNMYGLNLCNCSGSLQYTHLSCLKDWLIKKLRFIHESSNMLIFDTTQLKCELCNSEYPLQILISGIEVPLLTFESFYPKYITIRNLEDPGKVIVFDLSTNSVTLNEKARFIVGLKGNRVGVIEAESSYVKVRHRVELWGLLTKYEFRKKNAIIVAEVRSGDFWKGVLCGLDRVFCGRLGESGFEAKEVLLDF